LFKLLNR